MASGTVRMAKRAQGDCGPGGGVWHPSDKALMERFCRGEREAFDEIFARYAKALYLYLARIVKSDASAEELLQATFLAFARSRGDYQPGARVAPWLFSIASSVARRRLEHERSGAVREAPAAEEAPEGEECWELGYVDPGLSRVVRQALEKLPPAQREAVLMHRFHEMSFAEIAAAAGTSVGVAQGRALRGYDKLRSLLKNF